MPSRTVAARPAFGVRALLYRPSMISQIWLDSSRVSGRSSRAVRLAPWAASASRSLVWSEAEVANLFLQFVSPRYERASLIVTSNKLQNAGARSLVTTSSPPR